MKTIILALMFLPSLVFADTLEKGMGLRKSGDCPNAVRTLESYSEDHPESFEAWEALANCYYEMGVAGNAINMNQHDKSRRAAIRAFRLDQSRKDLLYIIGMTSLSVDDQAMAIGSYELLVAAGEKDQAGKLRKAMSAYEPPQMDGLYSVAVSRHSGGVRTVVRSGAMNDYEIRSKTDTWEKTVGRDYDKAIDSLGSFGFLSKAERETKAEMERAKAEAKAAYVNSLTGNQQETPQKAAQDDVDEIMRKHEKDKKLKRDLAITRSEMDRQRDRLEDEKRQIEHEKRQAESEKLRLESEKQQMQIQMDRERQQQEIKKFQNW